MEQNTKKEIMDKMKQIGSLIGMSYIKRGQGIYVSMNEIIKLKREFGQLSRIYKRKFYGEK